MENASQTESFIKLLSKKMTIQQIHTEGLLKILLSRGNMDTVAASVIQMMTTHCLCHLLVGNSTMNTKTIGWEIIDSGKECNPTSRKCLLCIKEKFHIIHHPDGSTLNSRSEFFSHAGIYVISYSVIFEHSFF